MGAAYYCQALWSERRFCGRNTEVALGLSGLPSSFFTCELYIPSPYGKRHMLTTTSQQHQ